MKIDKANLEILQRNKIAIDEAKKLIEEGKVILNSRQVLVPTHEISFLPPEDILALIPVDESPKIELISKTFTSKQRDWVCSQIDKWYMEREENTIEHDYMRDDLKAMIFPFMHEE